MMYAICRVVRAFYSNFAAAHVDVAFIDSMTVITPLLGVGLLANMKRDLPQYYYLVAIYIWKAAISLTLDGNTHCP